MCSHSQTLPHAHKYDLYPSKAFIPTISNFFAHLISSAFHSVGPRENKCIPNSINKRSTCCFVYDSTTKVIENQSCKSYFPYYIQFSPHLKNILLVADYLYTHVHICCMRNLFVNKNQIQNTTWFRFIFCK